VWGGWDVTQMMRADRVCFADRPNASEYVVGCVPRGVTTRVKVHWMGVAHRQVAVPWSMTCPSMVWYFHP
jgi:hypothetical protein